MGGGTVVTYRMGWRWGGDDGQWTMEGWIKDNGRWANGQWAMDDGQWC